MQHMSYPHVIFTPVCYDRITNPRMPTNTYRMTRRKKTRTLLLRVILLTVCSLIISEFSPEDVSGGRMQSVEELDPPHAILGFYGLKKSRLMSDPEMNLFRDILSVCLDRLPSNVDEGDRFKNILQHVSVDGQSIVLSNSWGLMASPEDGADKGSRLDVLVTFITSQQTEPTEENLVVLDTMERLVWDREAKLLLLDKLIAGFGGNSGYFGGLNDVILVPAVEEVWAGRDRNEDKDAGSLQDMVTEEEDGEEMANSQPNVVNSTADQGGEDIFKGVDSVTGDQTYFSENDPPGNAVRSYSKAVQARDVADQERNGDTSTYSTKLAEFPFESTAVVPPSKSHSNIKNSPSLLSLIIVTAGLTVALIIALVQHFHEKAFGPPPQKLVTFSLPRGNDDEGDDESVLKSNLTMPPAPPCRSFRSLDGAHQNMGASMRRNSDLTTTQMM